MLPSLSWSVRAPDLRNIRKRKAKVKRLAQRGVPIASVSGELFSPRRNNQWEIGITTAIESGCATTTTRALSDATAIVIVRWTLGGVRVTGTAIVGPSVG